MTHDERVALARGFHSILIPHVPDHIDRIGVALVTAILAMAELPADKAVLQDLVPDFLSPLLKGLDLAVFRIEGGRH